MSDAYDTENIFAKIIRGDIPCHKIYEDDQTLAFMDVMPQAPGHALVVPKAQSRNLFDASPATLAALLPVVQKIAVAAKRAFKADGVTISQFNERAAGQSVFHLHVHVIPRQAHTPLASHNGATADPAELADHAALLRAALQT